MEGNSQGGKLVIDLKDFSFAHQTTNFTDTQDVATVGAVYLPQVLQAAPAQRNLVRLHSIAIGEQYQVQSAVNRPTNRSRQPR